MERTDVLVVGAGIAGLTAALAAARHGAGVTVLCAQPPGGRARTTVQHGVCLNVGPHALYLSAPLHQVLRSIGIDPSGGSPAVGGAVGYRGGAVAPLPSGPMSLLRTRLLGPADKLRAARLLAGLPRLDPGEFVGRSVSEWLAACSPALRDLVLALCRTSTYADAPDLLDAGAAIRQMQLGFAGVRYVDGGWQVIVDALATEARSRGVRFEEGTQVLRIGAEGGCPIVETSRGERPARSVVVAAGGPAQAESLVGVGVPGADRLGPPIEAACWDLICNRLPTHSVVLGLGEPYYLSVHHPVAALGPEDRTLVSVAAYLPPGRRPASDSTRRALGAVAAAAGIETSSIVHERFLDHLTVFHGLPLATHRGLQGRPRHDSYAGTAPGVFVAGDWVGPTGMLADAAAASGTAAGEAAAHSAVGASAGRG